MKEMEFNPESAVPHGEGPEQPVKADGTLQQESNDGGTSPRINREKARHLAKKTAKDWSDRDVSTYASSIAFYFFMSMIPLLIIIVQAITRIGLTQQVLLEFIERLIPETSYVFAARVVYEAYRYTPGTLSVSALVLLWSASKGTMALRCGLNNVYDEEERRVYPVQVLISIGYTLIMVILFVVMLFIVFAGPASRFLIEGRDEEFHQTASGRDPCYSDVVYLHVGFFVLYERVQRLYDVLREPWNNCDFPVLAVLLLFDPAHRRLLQQIMRRELGQAQRNEVAEKNQKSQKIECRSCCLML